MMKTGSSFVILLSLGIRHSSFPLVDLRQLRLTNVSLPLPEGICPSSNYRVRECARALCGGSFPKPPLPPIRNLPGRRSPLPHPVLDCKNRSPPVHHRGSQTRPYLN